MNDEIWKSIEGYENYEVSSLGRVRSLKFGKSRIMKPQISRDGFLKIGLCRNGKRKMFYVHRLVAYGFLDVDSSNVNVKHIGLKTDNRVDNLICVSQFLV